MNSDNPVKTPWQLWLVAILSLLWNGSGAYTIIMAQLNKLPGLRADEIAYYAAQPQWFVLLTDLAVLAPVAAAIALFLRSRFAVTLFTIGLALVVINNAYDFGTGTSRALTNNTALIVTCIILVIAILQLWYSRAMRARGVLH